MTTPTGPTRPRMALGQDRKTNSDLHLEAHRIGDLDSGPNSQHHTLGSGRNQSSPGDHIHDGGRSKKLGAGMGLTLSGPKGGNVALANLIAMLGNFIEFEDQTT